MLIFLCRAIGRRCTLVASLFWVCSVSASNDIEILEGPGEYPSRDSTCIAEVRISSTGGFRVLSVRAQQRQVRTAIDDLTALAWLPDGRLIYSTSPIYGKPGIYVLDCVSGKVSRIVGPRTKVKGYPDGADYFAISSVRKARGFVIEYYYAENIDTAPADLRQPNLLKRVTLGERSPRHEVK
jgi:hypothetical protein